MDNGTQQIYATEIAFRAELEKAVNTMGTDAAGGKYIQQVEVLSYKIWSEL